VIHPVFEGILEACICHRAFGADALCSMNPLAVVREEHGRWEVTALASGHPDLSVHRSTPFYRKV